MQVTSSFLEEAKSAVELCNKVDPRDLEVTQSVTRQEFIKEPEKSSNPIIQATPLSPSARDEKALALAPTWARPSIRGALITASAINIQSTALAFQTIMRKARRCALLGIFAHLCEAARPKLTFAE